VNIKEPDNNELTPRLGRIYKARGSFALSDFHLKLIDHSAPIFGENQVILGGKDVFLLKRKVHHFEEQGF